MQSKVERFLREIPCGRWLWDIYTFTMAIIKTPRDRLPSIDLSLKIMTRMKEGVFAFLYAGTQFRFWLPFVGDDTIQSNILDKATFWDVETLEHVKKYIPIDSVVVDCGANIGNHTVFFAAVCKAKKVLAFEPQKICVDIFKRQMELNGVEDRVEIKSCALGSRAGTMSVCRSYSKNCGATMFDYDDSGDVPVVTIDSMNLEKIDFMKIDVEGAQLDLLEGARQTLARLSPVLLIELNNHAGEAGFDKERETNAPKRLLEDLGYEVAEKLSNTDYVFIKRKTTTSAGTNKV